LQNDLVEVLEASVAGTLDKVELKWSQMESVCVVMASAGYPGNVVKGKVIHGLDEAAKLANTKVFHAGTAMADGQVVTNGGRVLGITALGADIRSARDAAYSALERIGFDGAHYRRDIGEKAFERRKV
jgi:phosphoribosylamine--glycine ligase